MMTRCTSCGKSKRRSGTVPHRLSVGNYEFKGKLPTYICSNKGCGQVTVGFEDMATFELGVAQLLAESGRVSPDAFKFMRKVIGMKAKIIANLLGVAPETVSRWENGGLPVETKAFALLGCMVMDQINGHNNTAFRLSMINFPAQLDSATIKLRGISIRADISKRTWSPR